MTMEENKTYKVLGVSENAKEPEIKKAYRKLSLQHHPEKNGNFEESQNKFQEIQEAYEILSAGWSVNEKYFNVYSNFSYCIKNIKEKINQSKLSINEILHFSSPEKKKVYKNWLNNSYLICGLDKSFPDIKEHLKILQEVKKKTEIENFISVYLFKAKISKELSEEVEKSHDYDLLNDIINVEVSMRSDAPPYEEGKEYNNEEVLNREKASRYYETLGLSEKSSLGEINKRYRKLALETHSDKTDKEGDVFILIKKAHEVLGDETERKKYDLCLLYGEDGYLNRKKLSKIKRSGEPTNEEFRKDIELILQDELKKGDLNHEDYSQFHEYKGKKLELIKIEDFCQKVLAGISQYEAIELAKEYLSLADKVNKIIEGAKILNAKQDKKSYAIGKIEKELAKEPVLTREELDEQGEINCIKQLERLELKEQIKENDKELSNRSNELYAGVLKKILEVRAAKNSLLKKIEEKIEKGTNLLNSDDKGEIVNFLTEFDGFLDLENKESCEEEINVELRNIGIKRVIVNKKVIQSVFDQKREEINSLKEKLNDLVGEIGADLLGNEETTKVLSNNEPISPQQKQTIINYLDDLIFTNFAKEKTVKTPNNLKKVKNGLDLRRAEEIREKIVKNICGIIGGSGGSDETLNKKNKKILESLADLLKKEIENETKKTFTDLPTEQQNLLKIEGEINNTAKKLTQNKRKILNGVRTINTSNEKQQENNLSPDPILINEEKQTKKLIPEVPFAEPPFSENIPQPKVPEILETNNENFADNPENNIDQSFSESFQKTERETQEKREQEEKERQEREERLAKEQKEAQKKKEEWEYEKLLSDIETADIDKLRKLNKQIDNFNYDNLPVGKNKDAQEREQQAQIEQQRQQQEKITEINQTEDLPTLYSILLVASSDSFYQNNENYHESAKKQQETQNKLNDLFNLIAGTEKVKDLLALSPYIKNFPFKEQRELKIEQKKKLALLNANVKGIKDINLKAIEEEKKRLIELITTSVADEKKELERIEAQKKQKEKISEAVEEVRSYLNSKKGDDNKINRKTENDILGENWKDNFNSLTTPKQIEDKINKLKGLIDTEKLTEQEIIVYDDLSEDIQKTNNQEELNVLTDRINRLNYNNLPPGKKQATLEELKEKQQDILKDNWQGNLRKTTKDEIDREKERLKGLIDAELNHVRHSAVKEVRNALGDKLNQEEKEKILVERNLTNQPDIETKQNDCIKKIEESKQIDVNSQINAINLIKEDIQNQTGETNINARRDYYKKLIDQAKAIETDELIDGKTQENTLPPNWKNSIRNKNTKEEIDQKVGELKGLIDQAIKREIGRQNTPGARKRSEEENELNKNLKKLQRGSWLGLRGYKSSDICGEITVAQKGKTKRRLESEKTLVNSKEDFKEKIKGDEIEKYLQEIVKFIVDIEETKDFLNKALEIAGFQKFCNSIFKDIVEKGISNALNNENISVLELVGDPKKDILLLVDKQDKLNALEKTLKEIKEKLQLIAAENALKALVDNPTPEGNRVELRNDLENLRKLMPDYSSLSEAQVSAYQKKETKVNSKELELISKREIQNAFQTFKDAVGGFGQQAIKDAVKKLKVLKINAQKRIELIKWEEINSSIKSAVDSAFLEEGSELDNRIKNLCGDLLFGNKSLNTLKSRQTTRCNKLKGYEDLIKEINDADTWEKLKATYKTGRRNERGEETYYYNPDSPDEILNLNKEHETIKQRILDAYNRKDPQPLIKKESEEISKLIDESLSLPDDKGTEQLEEARDKKKDKLVFRKEFRDHAKNNGIDNNIIDSYFDKIDKELTAKVVAEVYSCGILANEIDGKIVEFAGRKYDLTNELELKKAQRGKIFINDFHAQGNIPNGLTEANILDYCKSSLNDNH
ncbi:26237_t:CDS:10 [Gigaspora margarita]|uniref:26237_t:CDS:1 n=1 Tax=Gigaspora margarita TaxID=4874 RepID=A0ABM8VVB9_GIGMA|nr:26237_t:CDS:10 [Gigaspora margarita]